MMRHLSVCTLLLAACGGADQVTPAPLKAGTTITGASQITSTTKLWKYTPEAGAVEQKGTIGTGSDCDVAGASSGTATVSEVGVRNTTLQVLGNTVSRHPLIPGEDVFGGIGISVVAEQVTEESNTNRVEVFEQPDADQETFTETTSIPDDVSTSSRFVGRAVDEFHVQIAPLDLYGDQSWLECEDIYCSSTGADIPPAPFRNDPTLLTMANPSVGDVWMSTNGNIVYRFEGSENVAIGDRTLRANKVQVFINGEYDGAAASVAEDCVFEQPFQSQTDEDEQTSLLSTQAIIDSGCENDYVHQQTGTQYWVDGVLVGFQGRTVQVEIIDAGYEWFVEADGVDLCNRVTSDVDNPDEDSNFFVQYRVVEEVEEFAATSWSEEDLSGNAE